MSDPLPWDFKNPTTQKQADQTLIQQTVPRIAAAADTFMANTTPDPEPEGSLSDLNFWFQPPTAAPPPPPPIPEEEEEEEEVAPVETYKNIVRGLSKIEIIPAAYDLAGPREDDATAVTADFVFGSYEDHGGESSRTKRVNANARQQGNSPGRASTKTRAVHHHPRRRSAEVHNMSERIRRDRIKKRIQTLQQLIPNCSTRDKESVLDSAIIHIKLLQHQITEMSMATSSSGFQAPYMFQGNYQGFHVPPRYGQFMHQMEHGFGMPVYGMPFAYPSPYRSNLASSQIPMFGGALSPNQMAFNPYRALPSYDTVGALSPNQMAFNPYRALPSDDTVGALSPNHQMTFNPYRALPTDDTVGALSPNQMAFNPYRALPTDDTVGALSPNQMAFNPFGPLPSADTISVHSTSSSCSSQSEPISFDFGQLPTMIQGLAPSVPNSRVLPTQIITPSSTR